MDGPERRVNESDGLQPDEGAPHELYESSGSV